MTEIEGWRIGAPFRLAGRDRATAASLLSSSPKPRSYCYTPTMRPSVREGTCPDCEGATPAEQTQLRLRKMRIDAEHRWQT